MSIEFKSFGSNTTKGPKQDSEKSAMVTYA